MAYKEEGVPILADCEYKQHKDDQLTEKLIPPTANLTTGTNTQNTVIANQPSHLPAVAVRQTSKKPSQVSLVLSLILLTVCPMLCNFPALVFLIPGVIFAVVGFNYSHSNDKKQSAGGFNGLSLCCSVTAIFSYIVTVVCLILFLGLAYGLRRYCYCYHQCSSGVCQTICTGC